jgi:hypothetical protein
VRWLHIRASSLFEVGEVKKELKNMELKNSGKRGWKRRVPNQRGINCGKPKAYEYRVCAR